VTTDSDIIRASALEPRAFGELFQRHARTIFRYTASRTNSEIANDLMAETFLIAFERRATFDHTWSEASPWLLGIATNLIRKHRTAEFKSFRAWERMIDPRAGIAAGSDAADRAEAAVAVKGMVREIRALSSDDRDTLLLFAWADLSYEEIAIAMNAPIGTVKSRLNRARQTLKTAEAAERSRTGENDGRTRPATTNA
jgi:RNA polymerase sigma factor (sigma-70 family)